MKRRISVAVRPWLELRLFSMEGYGLVESYSDEMIQIKIFSSIMFSLWNLTTAHSNFLFFSKLNTGSLLFLFSGLLIGRVSVWPAESYSDKSFSRRGCAVQKLELPVYHCRWKNHSLKRCIYCAAEVSGNLWLISRETRLMRALECLK